MQRLRLSPDVTDVAPDDQPADPHPLREGLPRVVEAAVEVVVFAPIGFVVDAPRLVPELARRGRREVEAARTLGGEVLEHGQRWLAGRMRGLTGETRDALRGLSHHRHDEARVDPDQWTEPAEPPAPPEPPTVVAAPAPAEAASDTDDEPRLDAPEVSSLAIPDYDNLSASQVVPRLAALDPSEREAVRRYERAGRSRKTILNRIAQLQGG